MGRYLFFSLKYFRRHCFRYRSQEFSTSVDDQRESSVPAEWTIKKERKNIRFRSTDPRISVLSSWSFQPGIRRSGRTRCKSRRCLCWSAIRQDGTYITKRSCQEVRGQIGNKRLSMYGWCAMVLMRSCRNPLQILCIYWMLFGKAGNYPYCLMVFSMI